MQDQRSWKLEMQALFGYSEEIVDDDLVLSDESEPEEEEEAVKVHVPDMELVEIYRLCKDEALAMDEDRVMEVFLQILSDKGIAAKKSHLVQMKRIFADQPQNVNRDSPIFDSANFIESNSISNKKWRPPKLTKDEWVQLAQLVMREGTEQIRRFRYLSGVFQHLQAAALTRLVMRMLSISSIRIFSGLRLDTFRLAVYNHYCFLEVYELRHPGTFKDGRVVNSYPVNDEKEIQRQITFYADNFFATKKQQEAAEDMIRKQCYHKTIPCVLGANLSTVQKLAKLHDVLDQIRAKRKKIAAQKAVTVQPATAVAQEFLQPAAITSKKASDPEMKKPQRKRQKGSEPVQVPEQSLDLMMQNLSIQKPAISDAKISFRTREAFDFGVPDTR